MKQRKLNVSKQNEVQNNYLWHETINKIFRFCNVGPTQPISSCRQPFPFRSEPKILFIIYALNNYSQQWHHYLIAMKLRSIGIH